METPLHDAARNGNESAIERLIQKSANVDAKDQYGSTPLFYAVSKGHEKCIELLIQNGSDVNAQSKYGRTPLHSAAQNGHEKCIELLIQNGSNVHVQNEDGITPLHSAVSNGHEKCIELLIQNGSDIHVQAKDGKTPLHCAARNGHEKCIELLIQNGSDVHAQAQDGKTPLHDAARNGHEKCIELLIQNGSDIHVQDKDGKTPLHDAAFNGHEKCIELLVQNGSDIHVQNKDGWTPLHSAARNGHEKCIELLIQNGSDIHVQDKDGKTPLHYAAFNGHEKCIELLIQSGSDVHVQDKDGKTPLHDAARNGHEKCIELLIQNGSDVHVQNKDGRTPLHDAARNGHKKCIESLIQNGSDVHVQDEYGRTPLHSAVSNGHEKCIELLIQNGSDVNAQSKYGSTPLHYAVSNGHEKCIELLIQNGSDVHVQDEDGKTPLHDVARNGHEKCIELLIQNGSDVHAQAKDGKTPLHDAARNGHEKCIELLIQNGSDVNAQSKSGSAPLHVAASNGHEKCLELLIQNGADIHAQVQNGRTPLHDAARNGHEKCIELLIRNGSDIHARDKVGKTPLHYYPGTMTKFAQNYVTQESLPKNLLSLYDLILESLVTGILKLDDLSLGLTDEDLDMIPWCQISPFLSCVIVNQREVTSFPIGLAHLPFETIEQIDFVVSENWKRLDRLKARESPKRIIEFCKAKLEGGLVKLKALRLMVMGGPAVGKTSMIRRLRGGKRHSMVNIPLSTDGVELGDVKLDNETILETWDFGGQKIYRVSHQLFIRDCCIFAVMCRLNDPVDVALKELQFWIDSILSRSEEVGHKVARRVGQIVLITTHADKLKPKEAEAAHKHLHKCLIDQYGEKRIYSRAIMLEWVGKGGKGGGDSAIKELKQVLLELSDQVTFDVPASLELIMVSLNNRCGGNPIAKISVVHEAIQKVGEQKGIKALQDEKRRLGFLKDLDKLGYIYLVHPRRMLSSQLLNSSSFRNDDDDMLSEMAVVLQPHWISRLLATLITTKHSFARAVGGVIDYDTLTLQLWRNEKDFPEKYHEDMINLLIQLHIMFPLRSTRISQQQQQQRRRYFIPCLLKEDEPQHIHGIEKKEFGGGGGRQGGRGGRGQNSVVLNRILRMKNQVSVPVAVMPMVIVQLMKIGEVLECWQQGCVVAIYSPPPTPPPLASLGDDDDPTTTTAEEEKLLGGYWWECCCLVKRKCGDELFIKLEAVRSEVAGWWMKEVMRSLENMLEEFYHVDYEVEVVYQGEGGGGVSCFPAGCHFSLDHLYKVVAQRKVTALCQNGVHNVMLQYLVPDLLISQEASSLSVVSWSDLKVEKELGKGSFGQVLLCSSLTNFQKSSIDSNGDEGVVVKEVKKKKKVTLPLSSSLLMQSPPSSSSSSSSSCSSFVPSPLPPPSLPQAATVVGVGEVCIPSTCENCTRREVEIFCAECEDETFLCSNCSETLHFSRKRKHHSPISIVKYFQGKEEVGSFPFPSSLSHSLFPFPSSPSPSPSPSSPSHSLSPSSSSPSPSSPSLSPSLSLCTKKEKKWREKRENKLLPTKFMYAAKVLEPTGDEVKLQKEFLLEVYTMTGLDHPNIVKLIGIVHPVTTVAVASPKKEQQKQFCDKHAMVMEFVGGGNLFENIHFIMGMNIPETVSDVVQIIETYQSKLNLHKSDPDYYPAPSAPLPPLSLLSDGGFQKINRSFEKWFSVAGGSHGNQINELKEMITTGIIRMYDGNFEGTSAKAVSKDLKVCGKKIMNLLHETATIYAPLPWILRLKIAFDIAQGIHYLHSSHNPPIIHRDLKSLNVILSHSLTLFPINKKDILEEILKEPLAKVVDFGFSVKLLGASSLIGGKNSKIEHITPLWVSPEVLSGQEYTEKADIYAIGIILWELLVRRIPFSLDVKTPLNLFVTGYVCKEGRPSIPPLILQHENENNPEIMKKYLALMNQCWNHQPFSRPSALQICESLYEMMQDDATSSSLLLKKIIDENGNLSQLQKRKEYGGDAEKKREESSAPLGQHHHQSLSSLDSLTKMVVSDMIPPPPPSLPPSLLLKLGEKGKKWAVKRLIFAGTDWVWIGFWNGYIGAIEVKKVMEGTPKVVLCNEINKHKEEVRAMVYQSVGGGYVWTSSMCGTLQVWKDTPLTHDNTIEHFNMRGWLKKVGKYLWSEDVWVSFDTGHLRIFKYQYHGTEEDSIPINKDTVVKSFLSNRPPAFQIQSPSKNKIFKFEAAANRKKVSPPLSQWVRAFEQFCGMLSLPLSLLHLAVKHPEKKEGSSRNGNGGGEGASTTIKGNVVGILGLEAIGHNVWGFTTTFEVVEFTLLTVEDEHGLHRTSRIETKRVLKLQQDDIEPRFQNIGRAGLVSMGKSTLCVAIGNAVGTISTSQVVVEGVVAANSCSLGEEMSGGDGGVVEWCEAKDRSPSYFRCLVSVWNGNWTPAATPTPPPTATPEKEETTTATSSSTSLSQLSSISPSTPSSLEAGKVFPKEKEEEDEDNSSTVGNDFPSFSSQPSLSQHHHQDTTTKTKRTSTTKQGTELWAYDGEKILIFRFTTTTVPSAIFLGGDSAHPSLLLPSPQNHFPSSLILVDEIKVSSKGFLSCLTQVGPNEVWGGTAASGIVMGWAIDTRSLLPHSPFLSGENAHDGNVSSLAAPGQMFYNVYQKRLTVFSGSSDGSLRMFCLRMGGREKSGQRKKGEKEERKEE